MKTIRADLHSHFETQSQFSRPFNAYVDLISARLGENGIVALVNFGDDRFEKFCARRDGYDREFVDSDRSICYLPQKKIFIIRGQEVPTSDGHLLFLCGKHSLDIKPHKPLEYTLLEAMDSNSITIAPHPFSYKGIGAKLMNHLLLLDNIDALEIHNGESVLPNWNKKAIEFYAKIHEFYKNVGALSVSDAHSLSGIATSFSELSFPNEDMFKNMTKENIATAIRSSLPGNSQKTSKYYNAVKHIAKLLGIKSGIL